MLKVGDSNRVFAVLNNERYYRIFHIQGNGFI